MSNLPLDMFPPTAFLYVYFDDDTKHNVLSYPISRLVLWISLLLVTLCLVFKWPHVAAVAETLASYLTHAAYSTPSLRLKNLLSKQLQTLKKKLKSCV